MAAGLKTIIALSFVSSLSASLKWLTQYLSGSRHRIPSRHPLLGPLSKLPYPPRGCDLCDRSSTKLDMWKVREP